MWVGKRLSEDSREALYLGGWQGSALLHSVGLNVLHKLCCGTVTAHASDHRQDLPGEAQTALSFLQNSTALLVFPDSIFAKVVASMCGWI